MYLTRAREEKLPDKLIDLYYFGLNEEKRIEAIRFIFDTYEKDKALVRLVDNLLGYFHWCRNCRNQILHAERYPPSFGGDPDTLYLIKRFGKQSPQSGYMKLKLQTLRFIADKIREGVVRCADIHIYLRFRDVPLHEVPSPYQAHVRNPLPTLLRVPKHLKLNPKP